MTDRPRDPSGQEHDLDLGDGHWLDWVGPGDGTTRIGAIVYHRLPPGAPDHLGNGMCAGSIRWVPDPDRPSRVTWDLQGAADEHLTVSPSLLCSCGDHGFIRQGRWVRA